MSASEGLLFEEAPGAWDVGWLADSQVRVLLSKSSLCGFWKVGFPCPPAPLSSPDVPHPQLGPPLPVCTPSHNPSFRVAKEPAEEKVIPSLLLGRIPKNRFNRSVPQFPYIFSEGDLEDS